MIFRRPRPLHVVFAGHVDHGKSTLIGRLLTETHSLPEDRLAETLRAARDLASDNELTFVTDQLEEERRLNITLDTCQIPFRTRKKDFVIIDAPGHAALVKNMLTGASAAEAAVLIVSASDGGVMEQTRRHAFVLGFLGVGAAIVAVNKMDLAGYDRAAFDRIKKDTEELLARAGVKTAAVVPVAAKSGENVVLRSGRMPWYGGPTIVTALEALKTPSPAKPRRNAVLPVQDSYAGDGGRLAVGRIASGTFTTGQRVTVRPGVGEATIREIRRFGASPRRAGRGENVGILLDGNVEPLRGQAIVAGPPALEASRSFDARIFWIGPEPLVPGASLVFKLCTQETPCRLAQIYRKTDSASLETAGGGSGGLEPNESAFVRLETDLPVWLDRDGIAPELGRFALEKSGLLQGCGYPQKGTS